MDFLNELEKEQVDVFVNNPVMYNAVKKIILSGIYFHGVLQAGEPAETKRNFMLGMASRHQGAGATNEVLGQDVRAADTAISMLEGGFQEIDKLKKVEITKKDKVNRAR